MANNRPKLKSQQETSPERFELLKRRDTVLEKRMGGMTLQAIANELGCSKATVLVDIRSCLREMYEDRIEKAEQLAQLQMARYEKMLAAWWDKALGGNVAASHIVLTTLSRIDQLFIKPQANDVGESVGEIQQTTNYTPYELARRLAYLLTHHADSAAPTIALNGSAQH